MPREISGQTMFLFQTAANSSSIPLFAWVMRRAWGVEPQLRSHVL